MIDDVSKKRSLRARQPGRTPPKYRIGNDDKVIFRGTDIVLMTTPAHIGVYNNSYGPIELHCAIDEEDHYSLKNFRTYNPDITLMEFAPSFVDHIDNNGSTIWKNPFMYHGHANKPFHDAGDFTIYSMGLESETIDDYIRAIKDFGLNMTVKRL